AAAHAVGASRAAGARARAGLRTLPPAGRRTGAPAGARIPARARPHPEARAPALPETSGPRGFLTGSAPLQPRCVVIGGVPWLDPSRKSPGQRHVREIVMRSALAVRGHDTALASTFAFGEQYASPCCPRHRHIHGGFTAMHQRTFSAWRKSSLSSGGDNCVEVGFG